MKALNRAISLILSVSFLLSALPMNISAEFVPIENTSINSIYETDKNTDIGTYHDEDSDGVYLREEIEDSQQEDETVALLSLSETVSGYCGGEGDGTNLTWSLTPDGVLTITGSGAMADYSDEQTPWQKDYADSCKTLVLAEGITSIGAFAFYECTALAGELALPQSVTTIGYAAFYNCSSFSGSLTIPAGVETIDDYAFWGCTGFDGNLNLNDSLTTIGRSAFYACSGLTGELELPEGIVKISPYTFYGCSGFDGYLSLGDNVTTIGRSAFYECCGLTGALCLPESIDQIDDYAFYGCYGFTGDLVIPEGITVIHHGSFCRCTGFTGALVLPSTVTCVEATAFYECDFTGELVLPEALEEIDEAAFYNCSGFTGTLVLPSNIWRIEAYAFFGCSGFTGELVIPEDIDEIYRATFYECSGFSSLSLSDAVTCIGQNAFCGCVGLEGDLLLPAALTEIGAGAFAYCNGFSSDVYIPSNVTTIGDEAFYQSVKKFYFCGSAPAVTALDKETRSFDADAVLYYSEGTVGWTDSEAYDAESSTWNGYQIDKWSPSQIIIASGYCGGEGDGTNLSWTLSIDGILKIDGVGEMADYNSSFVPWHNYSSSIISVVLGEGMTSVGAWAFFECRNTTGPLVLPDSIVRINNRAFFFCGFTGILCIPEKVVFIGERAFQGNHFTSINIPTSVEVIESEAFRDCHEIVSFTVDGNNVNYTTDEFGVLFNKTNTILIQYPHASEYTTYAIPNGVLTLDQSAFEDSDRLRYVEIPKSVTEIRAAFHSCDQLLAFSVAEDNMSFSNDEHGVLFDHNKTQLITYPSGKEDISYTIPSSVITIGQSAFYGAPIESITIPYGVKAIERLGISYCASLINISLPNSITTIDEYAFCGCSSLKEMIIPSSVAILGDGAFKYCDDLNAVFFAGDAPNTWGNDLFTDCAEVFTIFYAEDTTGWTDSEYYDAEAGTWYGYKLATWTPDESCSHSPDTDPSLYVGSTFAYMDEMHHYVTGDRYVKVCAVCDEWYDAAEYPRDTSLPENQERHKFDPATGYCWACDHICQHSYSIEYEGDDPVEISGSGVWKKADDTYCKKYVRYWMVCAYCGNRVRGVDEYEDGSVKKHNSKTTEKISQLPDGDKDYTVKHWVTTTYTACTRNCGYTDGNKTTTTTEAHTLENGVCTGCGYTAGETTEESSGKYQYMIPLGGEKISFDMPDSVPFVGGDTFSLAFPHVPLSMKAVGDKVYVGINFDLTPENEPFDSRIKEVKKFINRVKSANGRNVGNTAQKEMNYLMQDKNQKAKFGSPDVSLSVLGYGEGTRDETGNAVVTVYLYVSAEFERTLQGPTIVLGGVLPVTYSISFQGSASSDSDIQWNPAASTFTGEVTLTLQAKMEAFGGAGIGEVVAAGVYGSATTPCEIQLISSVVTPGVNTWDLIGELGAKAYLGPLEYKKSWAKKTWHLYSRSGGWLPASTRSESDVQLMSGLYDTTQYTLADLSYLSNESPWAGDAVSLFSFSEPNELIALQSDTYRNMRPVLGNADGIPVLVWVRANTERGTYDYPELVYSVYENGIWSAPAVVDDNATLDSAPALCTASDGTLWIVYQDTREALNSGDLEELIKKQTIRAARFDVESGSFTDFKTLSTEGVFSRTPILTNVDGILTALWVENSDNSNYFGTNATNRVCFARYVEGGWTSYTLAAGLNAVTEIAAGYCVDGISAVVVTDEDNDLSTQDDRILTQYDGLSSDGRVLESGMIASPVFAILPGDSVETLLWSDGTHLKKYDAEEITAVLENDMLCEGFTVLQDRIVFNAADGDGSNLFASIWDGEKWSTTVQMTTQEQYLQSYSIANINGAMWLATVQADVSITESDVAESCTLSWAVLSDNVDLGIDNVHVDHSTEALNRDVPVFVDVTNYGTTTISEYTVTVGSVVKNVKTDIAPGETATVELEFPLGETVTTTTYTASVTVAQDCETENDSQPVTIGYADLATKVEFLRTQEIQEIVVTVSNTGVVPTAGDMVIELPAGYGCGYSIPELAPGESCVFSEAVTIEALGGEVSGLVSVLVDAYETEWDELNNDDQVFVTVYPEETVAVSAVSESAVTLNIHSSRDALVYLAVYSAEGQLVKIVSTEIAAGEEEANLNIDLAELPHGGTVKAFLLDKQTFMPICKVSTREISSRMAY